MMPVKQFAMAGPRLVKGGDKLQAEDHNSMARMLQAQTIRHDGGMMYRPQVLWPRFFDLRSVASNSYTIRAFKSDFAAFEGMAWFRGVWKDITAGAGLTLAGGDWESGTLTDNTKQYVYLDCDRTQVGATSPYTIKVAAALPNGDDDTEIFPLWYLPWDAVVSGIDFSQIMDMRDSVRLIGMV